MLIITAFQRSGTTALGEQLGALPDYAYWGEVFHPDGYDAGERSAKLRLRPGANWFRFVEEDFSAADRRGPQHEGLRRDAWELYKARLAHLGSGRRPILDIKYNSWRHVEPVWSSLGGRPFLFELLREQEAVFVHLVRDDVLAQGLSEVFSFQSGLWHRRFGESLEFEAFKAAAEPQSLLVRMRESRRETALMRTWLADLPHAEIRYETAFAVNGDMSEDTRAALAGLSLDTRPAPRGPVLGRTGQSPRQWLSNIDDVLAALAGTEFEDLGATLA